MATWEKFATEAPDLAGVVRERFQAFRHHVLATVRHDGAPRVSGTEVSWWGADLTIGSMPGARKALDLRRDGRFALHVNPGDGSMDGGGDVKVSGRAVEVVGAEQLPGEPEEVDRHISLAFSTTEGPAIFAVATLSSTDVDPTTAKTGSVSLVRLSRDHSCSEWETVAQVPLGA